MRNLKKGIVTLVMLLCLAMVSPVTTTQIFNVETVQAAAKMNKTKATLVKGQSLQLKVNGNSKKVKWSSSKKNVATVTSKGKVTAKNAGIAVITAKVGSKKYTCKITVEAPKISKTSISLTVGGKYTLKITGTKQKVTWSSSNKAVATVSGKGIVVAKKAGTTKITAKVGTKKYTCSVSVKSKKSTQNTNTKDNQIKYAALGWLTLDEDSLYYYGKIPSIREVYVDTNNNIWFHYVPKLLPCWAQVRIVPQSNVLYRACYHPSIPSGKALEVISYVWSYEPNVKFVKSLSLSDIAGEKAKLKKAQEYIITG